MSYEEEYESFQDYKALLADAEEKTFVVEPVEKATAFEEGRFTYHGGYLEYYDNDYEKKIFIARFKYAATSSWKSFKNFLKKNFTVEEYLGRLESGESPFSIAESKGYVLSHVKKWLKDAGYPQTPEGFKDYTLATIGYAAA